MSKADKFYEKLEALQKETGYEYEIKTSESFDKHIEDNTLYAGWFEPGTVLAIVDTGSSVLNFKVSGPLEANLLNADGETVHAFKGTFDHFEDDNVSIKDDKDIEALTDGNHPSGYCLIFEQNSSVEVIIGDEEVEPILAEDPSVARCILKKEYVQELVKASAAEEEIRKEALNDAMTQLDFVEMPDSPTPPEKEGGGEKSEPSDIPHYPETDEGKAEEERLNKEDEEADKDEVGEDAFPAPVKEEVKKATKKQTKAKKAKASKSKSEDAVGRFDLLPLDIVGRIVSGDIDNGDDREFLSIIEDYKKTKDEEALLVAAMHLAEYYGSPTDFVMALAVLVEKEAEEHGEDAWKEKDTVRCLNEAIRNYLIFLKAGNEDDILLEAAWSLICAAKAEKDR